MNRPLVCVVCSCQSQDRAIGFLVRHGKQTIDEEKKKKKKKNENIERNISDATSLKGATCIQARHQHRRIRIATSKGKRVLTDSSSSSSRFFVQHTHTMDIFLIFFIPLVLPSICLKDIQVRSGHSSRYQPAPRLVLAYALTMSDLIFHTNDWNNFESVWQMNFL